MKTRHSKSVDYKVTRTNRKRGGSPATETPGALSARDQRARTRRITKRNAGTPPKPISKGKGKGKETADSTKKGVKFTTGVEKAVASGKGKGRKRDGRASAARLMQAFFRENRDSVKNLNFNAQQKKLGAMWKKSPLNPKNETSIEKEEDDDNSSSTVSERLSAPGSTGSRADENDDPNDELMDEMDDTSEKPAGGPSADPSSETSADATAAQSSDRANILRHRPTAAQPYPEEDPDGIYYLTESGNEGGKTKGKKKKKSEQGKLTRRLLKEVAIGANRILEEGKNGGPSKAADGPSGKAAVDEDEEASDKGN